MNVLVTGISRGVGLAIAKVILRESNCVYGIYRTPTPELEALKKQYPDSFFVMPFDLKDTSGIKKEIFQSFIGNNVPLHGFVNNAAEAYDDLITNMDLKKVEAMFNVNVFAPLLITKLAIRNMLFHNISGSIVHISSISAHTGYKGLGMYAASKGAIEAFSKGVSREWGIRGIRSNVVVPGFMETDMSASLSNEQKQKIYGRNSLKKATDILSVAETVLFLLNKNGGSITGQNIHVDAGTL